MVALTAYMVACRHSQSIMRAKPNNCIAVLMVVTSPMISTCLSKQSSAALNVAWLTDIAACYELWGQWL